MSSEGISIKVVPGAQTPETPPRRTARPSSSPSPSPERIASVHTPRPRRSTPQPSDSSTHLSPESKGRRRSSTSSRRSVSPQASNRARPYDRATPIDLSSHEEPRNGRLIRQQSKIRDQEAYIYWYETSSDKPLEGPPLALLEDLELADGYFFINWTDAIYWQAWRYQDGDKSWKKMTRGDSGDQGKNGKEPRYFVVTPNTGVPSFVSRTNYMSKYNVMGYM
ncbi:hypothetical protein BJ165DRAFT_1468846 [Panaeolus papilionaceus]|nr:hypothetical protein BJ165DRAFT_1468846 [Panaeolus papilionaceus]